MELQTSCPEKPAADEVLLITSGDLRLAARGANDSLIHVDWMIGSSKLDIDGVTATGAVEPLMRQGEWA